MRKPVFSKEGAKPVGPYSPGVVASGKTLYVSGQGPIDPKTGTFDKDDIKAQVTQVCENISAVLEAAGTSWANVVRVGVFLSDMGNFSAMNEVYGTYVVDPYPARTTVQAQLPGGIDVEIDCIALLPED